MRSKFLYCKLIEILDKNQTLEKRIYGKNEIVTLIKRCKL